MRLLKHFHPAIWVRPERPDVLQYVPQTRAACDDLWESRRENFINSGDPPPPPSRYVRDGRGTSPVRLLRLGRAAKSKKCDVNTWSVRKESFRWLAGLCARLTVNLICIWGSHFFGLLLMRSALPVMARVVSWTAIRSAGLVIFVLHLKRGQTTPLYDLLTYYSNPILLWFGSQF